MMDEIFDRGYQAARGNLNAVVAEAFSRHRPDDRRQPEGAPPHRMERALGAAQEASSPRITAPLEERGSTHRAPLFFLFLRRGASDGRGRNTQDLSRLRRGLRDRAGLGFGVPADPDRARRPQTHYRLPPRRFWLAAAIAAAWLLDRSPGAARVAATPAFSSSAASPESRSTTPASTPARRPSAGARRASSSTPARSSPRSSRQCSCASASGGLLGGIGHRSGRSGDHRRGPAGRASSGRRSQPGGHGRRLPGDLFHAAAPARASSTARSPAPPTRSSPARCC